MFFQMINNNNTAEILQKNFSFFVLFEFCIVISAHNMLDTTHSQQL